MSGSNATLAYFRGEFLPAANVAIPYWDRALSSGAAVSEQLRTAASPRGERRLVFPRRHFARFAHGLQVVGLELGLSQRQIQEIAERLVAENSRDLPETQQLGVCLVASPGGWARWAPAGQGNSIDVPWLLVTTYELPAEPQDVTDRVVSLRTVAAPDVSPSAWPKNFKHRSRLHYYLAEQAAERMEPAARPLLLNAAGELSESSTAAILVWCEAGYWVLPPADEVFASVTAEVIVERAAGAGVAVRRRPVPAAELRAAVEIVWGNTPSGLRAVTRLDGRPVGGGVPGPRFAELEGHYRAWVAEEA